MAVQMVEVPWEELTPEKKFEKRCQAWLSPPGINFVSPEACRVV